VIKTTAVIPARLGSTRLPNKVLADLCGKTLVRRVWEQVSQAARIDEVYIATDSPEVLAEAESWGGRALMTSPACQSGTERIASVISQLHGDLILNVQGDEPLIDPGMLDELVRRWEAAPSDLITPAYRIERLEELLNPNIVKVVRAGDGRALYFSRSAVPYLRDLPQESWLESTDYWGHVGVYGYRRFVLERYAELPASWLEQSERLEQLRFLEAGYAIQVFETAYRPVAVDVQADLERVRELLGC
jgi:3-deoxy-manno-octulosonate cytidylyltransferase (CMP-KDO synthetase)